MIQYPVVEVLLVGHMAQRRGVVVAERDLAEQLAVLVGAHLGLVGRVFDAAAREMAGLHLGMAAHVWGWRVSTRGRPLTPGAQCW